MTRRHVPRTARNGLSVPWSQEQQGITSAAGAKSTRCPTTIVRASMPEDFNPWKFYGGLFLGWLIGVALFAIVAPFVL